MPKPRTTSGRVIRLKPLVIHNPYPQAFDPPERMKWSASSVKLFKRCRRKFFWSYIARLKPRTREIPFIIGGLGHEAVAEWYRRRQVGSMEEIAEGLIRPTERELRIKSALYDEHDFDKLMADIAMMTGMLMGYEEVYGEELGKWSYGAEHIEQRWELDMGDFDFVGVLDLAAKRKTKVGNFGFVVEHKFVSKIEQSYLETLPLDIQARSYLYGAIKALGFHPSEILFDLVKKCKLRLKAGETPREFNKRIAEDYMARPDFYFHREPLPFGRSDMDNLEFEVRQTHADFMHIVTTHDHPDNPRNWPINDGECKAFFKLCPYHRLCTQGLDRGTAMNFEQRERVADAETAAEED